METPSDITGPVRTISPIVEIAAANYNHLQLICSQNRGKSFAQLLEQQEFDGVEIFWSSVPHVPKPTEICRVPHFGHDISCGGECHGDGVFRLFEIQCLISVDADIGPRDRLKIGDGIELRVSHTGSVINDTEKLEFRNGDPQVGRLGRSYQPEEVGTEHEEQLDEQISSLGLCENSSHQETLSELGD